MEHLEERSRPVALLAILASLVLGGVSVWSSSCSRHAPGAGEAGTFAQASLPADSIALSLSLDRGSYAVGERINMGMVAHNTSGRSLRLTFPTAQRYDFVVKKQGRAVWQWSGDMMFAQAIATDVLAPGESLSFACQWDQKLADGTNAALGAYTAEAMLKTAPEKATGEKRFGIVD